MSVFETRRQLRRLWRSEGNARLKGLMLAALDDGPRPEEVGQAWITDPEDRKRQLQHVPEKLAGRRLLKTPVTQQYNPAWHDDFSGNSKEHNVARTLADSEFKGSTSDPDSEAGRFMAGEGTVDKDRYIKRALLQNSVAELDVLFREELETTLIMGAAPRKIAREIGNVINVNRQKGDLPRGSDQSYAEKHAQGATIRTGDKSFDTVSYTAEKYAAGWEITDELMRQSEIDVAEALIRDAGAQVENAVNRVFLTNLIDSAGQEHDTTGSNQDATMVNLAIEQVELQNFFADTLVVHPEFKTDLFEDTNLAYANRAGSDDVIRQREYSPLFDLEMATMSDGAANGTQTWGFAADGEIGAVAYQRDHAALVIWDEFDMETKDYDDPVRDLMGGNVRSYVDSVYRQPDAACRVEY